jgi:hypothetical protein
MARRETSRSPTRRFLANEVRTAALGSQPAAWLGASSSHHAVRRRHIPPPFRLPSSGPGTLSDPRSSFGSQTLRASAPSPPFGRRTDSNGKSIKYVTSRTDLLGVITKNNDIFGSPDIKLPVHKEWQGKSSASMNVGNWMQRDGFGTVPQYLTASHQKRVANESLRGFSMPNFSKGNASEETMRLREHPLMWSHHRKMRRATSATSLRSSGSLAPTRSISSTSLCCTFGLHPSFGRPSSQQRLASQGH